MKSLRYFQVFAYSLSAMVLISAGFMNSEALDLTMHDTYYVIPYYHCGLILAVPFILFAIVSFIFIQLGRNLNGILFWIHWILSNFSLLGIIIMMWSLQNVPSKRYSDFSVYDEFDNVANSNTEMFDWLTIFVFAPILIQLIFVINVFVTSFGKKNNSIIEK